VIRRVEVQGQPGQNVSENSSQSINQTWWYKLVIPAAQEGTDRRPVVQGQPQAKTQDLICKAAKAKKGLVFVAAQQV
jgi:hypothetical protein